MSMLRRALEDADTTANTPKMVVMTGPLSDVYTQALNEVYAKQTENGEVVATESQQQDVMLLRELATVMNGGSAPPTDAFQTVYGVSHDTTDEKSVVDLTTEISKTEDPSNFVLIIDRMQPDSASGADPETLTPIQAAMECMVVSHGGKVYRSLGEFAKSR
jgi:hypothetical protein